MLAYLAPLPPSGVCPRHGQDCTHGSSCPTAKRQLAEEAAAACQTANAGHEAKAKRYRCSISSCHGEAPGLVGMELPFIVDLAVAPFSQASSIELQQNFCLNEHISFKDISKPPEGLLFS